MKKKLCEWPGCRVARQFQSVSLEYINRAMPWNAPKSLTDDEVYAVTAYFRFLGDIIDQGFVMARDDIAQVQQRLPDRNRLKPFMPMWRVSGQPSIVWSALFAAILAKK